MKNRIAKFEDSKYPPEATLSPRGDTPEPASSMQRALGQLETYIAEHPKLTIGIGLSLGVLVGWLVKRR